MGKTQARQRFSCFKNNELPIDNLSNQWHPLTCKTDKTLVYKTFGGGSGYVTTVADVAFPAPALDSEWQERILQSSVHHSAVPLMFSYSALSDSVNNQFYRFVLCILFGCFLNMSFELVNIFNNLLLAVLVHVLILCKQTLVTTCLLALLWQFQYI